MKRLLFSMAVLSLVAFVSCKPDDDKPGEDNGGGSSNETGTFTDTRDGKTYKTVTIGDQTWLAENLNYEIHEDSSSCYDDDTDNCVEYGKLYEYKAIDDAIPDGWHLPSDEEWKELEVELGMPQADADKESERGDIAGKLRVGGSSGLDLLIGGYIDQYNQSIQKGSYGVYWSSSKKSSTTYYIRAVPKKGDSKVTRSTVNESSECSIRCIKD